MEGRFRKGRPASVHEVVQLRIPQGHDGLAVGDGADVDHAQPWSSASPPPLEALAADWCPVAKKYSFSVTDPALMSISNILRALSSRYPSSFHRPARATGDRMVFFERPRASLDEHAVGQAGHEGGKPELPIEDHRLFGGDPPGPRTAPGARADAVAERAPSYRNIERTSYRIERKTKPSPLPARRQAQLIDLKTACDARGPSSPGGARGDRPISTT